MLSLILKNNKNHSRRTSSRPAKISSEIYLARIADSKILIAEDNELNADLMKAIIDDIGGSEVFTARDGKEALDILSGKDFDLLILDIMMPRVNGLDVLKEVRNKRNKNDFPILIVSSIDDAKTITTGIEMGANDYIVKPIISDVFKAKIVSLINQKKIYDLLENTENVLSSLVSILEAKDYSTKGHSERVSKLAEKFGRHLGIPESDCWVLRRAGLLHDIGKIGIPDGLLRKKGRLSEEEWVLMKNHPTMSANICLPLTSFKLEIEVIKHHHERFDGKGYPGKYKGNEIPYLSRILAIVDSYDAMTKKRPYRETFSFEEALKTMQNELFSGQWDPELTRKFIKFMLAGNN